MTYPVKLQSTKLAAPVVRYGMLGWDRGEPVFSDFDSDFDEDGRCEDATPLSFLGDGNWQWERIDPWKLPTRHRWLIDAGVFG